MLPFQYTPGKYEISRRENRCILKIQNAAKDDAGEFACEVEGHHYRIHGRMGLQDDYMT